MIYLNSTDSFVNFPRTNKTEYREYTLKLTNQTTQTETVAKHLQNTSNNSSFYILSVLDIVKSLDNGQYDYYILEPDNNSIIESGVIQFGEYQIQNTMAYTNSVKINSYNPYIPPTPKPKKVLDVSLNGDYDVEDYDVCSVDVFVPETEVVTKTYDDNGKYMIKPSSSDKVMSEVDVTVNVPKRKEEQVKSITIPSSGDYTVTPDEGKVLSEVDITVPTIKETYDFNEIGYTNDLIDFNSDIANSKLVYDRFNGGESISGLKQFCKDNNFNLVFTPLLSWDNGKNTLNRGDLSNMPNAITMPIDVFSGNTSDLFNGNSSLAYLPKTLTIYKHNNHTEGGSIIYLNGAFQGCPIITSPNLNVIYDEPTNYSINLTSTFKGCTSLTNIPKWVTTENIGSMFGGCGSAFEGCTSLKLTEPTTIHINGMNTDCSKMFYETDDFNAEYLTLEFSEGVNVNLNNCFQHSKIKTLPKITPPEGYIFSSCAGLFADCTNLTDASITINAFNASYLFSRCNNLETLYASLPKSTQISSLVYGYGSMKLNTIYLNIPSADGSDYNFEQLSLTDSLTNVIGLQDWGKGLSRASRANMITFGSCSKLTSQSVDNIADTIYDMTEKGFSPTMTFHSTVYNNMTDEQKAKFAAKNWTVVSA